jgi:glutathione reductase (NADPH)
MASRFGAKVAIAEEYRIGGTCVIRGCVPKKLFVYASHFAEDFETAKTFGWQLEGQSFSWKTLIENKDKEIARLSKIYSDNLDGAGVEIYPQKAKLKSPTEIELADGKTLTADKILIATGGSVSMPPLEGIENAIGSNEVFDLPRLPESVVVVGGGYIAVEFAGIFHGLGVKTTLAYRGEQILRGFDRELRDNFHRALVDKGINVLLNHSPVKLTKEEIFFDKGESIKAERIMFATGRKPYTQNLGLENCGVALQPNGAVKVNEFSQSSVENIYAVGDVTDRVNLTPIAIREGAAFARTTFNKESVKVDHNLVATAVFSQPQLGTLGLTEEQAVEKYGAVDVYSSRFRPMKLSFSRSEEKIFMKLLVEPKSDKVLGVHLMGAEAGELIQTLAIPLVMGATKEQFDQAIAVHPTSAEELVTMAEPTRQVKK